MLKIATSSFFTVVIAFLGHRRSTASMHASHWGPETSQHIRLLVILQTISKSGDTPATITHLLLYNHSVPQLVHNLHSQHRSDWLQYYSTLARERQVWGKRRSMTCTASGMLRWHASPQLVFLQSPNVGRSEMSHLCCMAS